MTLYMFGYGVIPQKYKLRCCPLSHQLQSAKELSFKCSNTHPAQVHDIDSYPASVHAIDFSTLPVPLFCKVEREVTSSTPSKKFESTDQINGPAAASGSLTSISTKAHIFAWGTAPRSQDDGQA